MSESVEQAALARTERDALPAPWGSMLDAMEALSRLNDGRFKLMQAINSRHDDELAEIRDGMLALGNRIEAITRGWKPRRESALCRACHFRRTFTEGKCDYCGEPIVGVGEPL